MTLPTTGQERRSLCEMMETTRGKAMSTPDLGLIAPTDKIEDALDDLDDIVRRDYNVSEEDMFCPQPLPILLESLPQILRASRHSDFWNRNGTSNQLLQQRQLKRTTFFQSCTSTLFDQNIHPLKGKLRSISRELLQLNGKFDVIMATEFFPMLCRIGALEENFEALERQRDKPVDDSCRRTTRRHARNMRRHYFDSLSRKLEWDEASMSSSDLGQAMAKTLLTYKAVAT